MCAKDVDVATTRMYGEINIKSDSEMSTATEPASAIHSYPKAYRDLHWKVSVEYIPDKLNIRVNNFILGKLCKFC